MIPFGRKVWEGLGLLWPLAESLIVGARWVAFRGSKESLMVVALNLPRVEKARVLGRLERGGIGGRNQGASCRKDLP